VHAATFSPDGRTLVTSSDDHTVRLWDVANKRNPQTTAVLTGHSDAVYAVTFSADNKTIATAGIITNLRVLKSKKGDFYAQANLEDMAGSVDMLVFPEAYRKLSEKVKWEIPVLIKGGVRIEEGANPKLTVNDIYSLEDAKVPLPRSKKPLDFNADGTYAFRSDAHDGVQAHAGSFAASNGAWTMKAKTGYAGSGNYLYEAPNIFIATSQLGAVSWLRPGLAQVAMRCTVVPQKPTKPAMLDANLIGTWQLPVKTGNWVWEIAANGTYKFHSEALDGAPSHAGVFTATKGQWTLTATTGLPGYTDNGQYLFQAPNIWMAKGKLGGAAWTRPCNR